jgi:hypothetical protein
LTITHDGIEEPTEIAMNDNLLKKYADSGLRTVEDWSSLGRANDTGAKPPAVAPHQGAMLPLFTRHQTRSQAQLGPKRH